MNTNQIKKSLKETPIHVGFFFTSIIIIGFALINFHYSLLESFIVLCKLISLNIVAFIVSSIMFRFNYENIRKLFNVNTLPLKIDPVDETALVLKVLLYGSFPWCGWLGLILKLGGGDITNTHLYEFLAVSLILPLCGYIAIKAYHFKILDAKVLPSVKLKFSLSSMLMGVLLTSLGYYFG